MVYMLLCYFQTIAVALQPTVATFFAPSSICCIYIVNTHSTAHFSEDECNDQLYSKHYILTSGRTGSILFHFRKTQ